MSAVTRAHAALAPSISMATQHAHAFSQFHQSMEKRSQRLKAFLKMEIILFSRHG
jgi:hypothetical protein